VSSVQGKAPSGRSRVLAPGAWLGVRVLVLAAVVLSCRAGSLRAWVDFSWFWGPSSMGFGCRALILPRAISSCSLVVCFRAPSPTCKVLLFEFSLVLCPRFHGRWSRGWYIVFRFICVGFDYLYLFVCVSTVPWI
jgi:hypothetical protein